MRFHILQHVPFEGPAAIADWLQQNNHKSRTTRFFEGDTLPNQDEFDVLIVMGGPMGVEDVDLYPWLLEERQFIQQVIAAGKVILGICLGAQLIARACGAAVVKNADKEIGWFDISCRQEEDSSLLHAVFKPKVEVFHWHGDRFEIPAEAEHFAGSEACHNQGFILNNRVIGLQFHIETTEASVKLLVNNCRDELDGSVYVQSEAEIFSDKSRFVQVNAMLHRLLENIVDAESVG